MTTQWPISKVFEYVLLRLYGAFYTVTHLSLDFRSKAVVIMHSLPWQSLL